MDTNVSLELGKNFTELIERLAQAIGTTADKIFPWYVRQEYLCGVIELAVSFTIISILSMITVIAYKRLADDRNHSNDLDEVWMGVFISSAFLLVFVLFGASLGMSSMITSVLNPQYGAVHAMISDIAKMTGK
jgi:nitrate/nitrite transporter NarK